MGKRFADVKVNIDSAKIGEDIVALLDSDRVGLEIHNLFAQYCDDYVPMDEGNLTNDITVEPDGVTYNSPYAHYQYTGVVYGPNIPIDFDDDGNAIAWRSPAGKGSKYPTERKLNYSTEAHGLATDHWDKAMMNERGDRFVESVKDIVTEEVRRKYGR